LQIKVIVKLINIRILVTMMCTAMSVNYPILRFWLGFNLYYFSLFNYSFTMNRDSIPSRRKIYCPQCTDLNLGFTQSPIPGLSTGQEVNLSCPSSIKVMNT